MRDFILVFISALIGVVVDRVLWSKPRVDPNTRITVTLNDGEPMTLPLGKALQAMATIIDDFANEIDRLQAELDNR